MGRRLYTVSIERHNKPITVVAMRIGKDVAEIPLLATLTRECNDRRSGMCRVLMDELEKQNVCNGEFVDWSYRLWQRMWQLGLKFGFSVMESSERLELLRHGLFDFVGTVMCFLKEREEPGESSPTGSARWNNPVMYRLILCDM